MHDPIFVITLDSRSIKAVNAESYSQAVKKKIDISEMSPATFIAGIAEQHLPASPSYLEPSEKDEEIFYKDTKQRVSFNRLSW